MDNELMEFIIHGEATKENIDLFNNSEGAKEMSKIIQSLLGSISNKDFYYSLPIKPGNTKGTIQANSFVSGEKGFSEEFFGDKFFISVTPESGRLLFNLEGFLESTTKSSAQPTQSILPAVLPPPPPFVNDGQGNLTPYIEPTVETEVNAGLNSSIIIKEVSEQFGNKQKQESVELVLTQVAPFLVDFKQRLDSILTSSFKAVNDVQKAEKLLNGLNLLDKTGVSMKTISIVLGITDTKQLRPIVSNINTMLKNCK